MIIFSEERGEKESHTLLPTEKMTVFASGQKVVKYESFNRGTKVHNCTDAASGLHKKSYMCSNRERQVRTLAGVEAEQYFDKLNNHSKRGYSPGQANEYASERKERFRRHRTFTEEVKEYVIKCLTEEQWSPEQIVGDAKRRGIAMVIELVEIRFRMNASISLSGKTNAREAHFGSIAGIGSNIERDRLAAGR